MKMNNTHYVACPKCKKEPGKIADCKFCDLGWITESEWLMIVAPYCFEIDSISSQLAEHNIVKPQIG
jgi:hypothetical protein